MSEVKKNPDNLFCTCSGTKMYSWHLRLKSGSVEVVRLARKPQNFETRSKAISKQENI